jgi:hypothetical protein
MEWLRAIRACRASKAAAATAWRKAIREDPDMIYSRMLAENTVLPCPAGAIPEGASTFRLYPDGRVELVLPTGNKLLAPPIPGMDTRAGIDRTSTSIAQILYARRAMRP